MNTSKSRHRLLRLLMLGVSIVLGLVSASAVLAWVSEASLPLHSVVVLDHASPSLEMGKSVSPGGDINGDGFADMLVTEDGPIKVYALYGSPTGLAAERTVITLTVAEFDSSVSTAGDVNGDGYSDIVIGSPWYNSRYGRVLVFPGSGSGLDATPVFSVTGQQQGSGFGTRVSGAGDINGDGYSDFLVGTYQIGPGGVPRTYLYLGSPSGLAVTPTITLPKGSIPFDGAGDINSDGFDDIILGGLGAFIHYGSAQGISTTANLTLTNPLTTTAFGSDVAAAGDVNGDGYSDVLVGAASYSSGSGMFYLYLGSASGLNTTPVFSYFVDSTSDFAHWLATAGDISNDGFDDIIVGAEKYNQNRGRVYLFLGSAGGLLPTSAITLTGETSDSRLGNAVGSAGDVNADGFDDFVVGAWGYNNFTGRAYIYISSAEPPLQRLFLPLIQR